MKTAHAERVPAERDIVARHGLAAYSPDLEQRVLRAARKAWERSGGASEDVPWGVPVFRLAVSVALTVGLVAVATATNRHLTARWRTFPSASSPASRHTAPLDDAGLSGWVVAAARLPPRCAHRDLARRSRLIQELLNTTRATRRGNGNGTGG